MIIDVAKRFAFTGEEIVRRSDTIRDTDVDPTSISISCNGDVRLHYETDATEATDRIEFGEILDLLTLRFRFRVNGGYTYATFNRIEYGHKSPRRYNQVDVVFTNKMA